MLVALSGEGGKMVQYMNLELVLGGGSVPIPFLIIRQGLKQEEE